MFGDEPVLMDVNTRPAGGLHQLALCGINAPWAAVQLALGEETGERGSVASSGRTTPWSRDRVRCVR